MHISGRQQRDQTKQEGTVRMAVQEGLFLQQSAWEQRSVCLPPVLE